MSRSFRRSALLAVLAAVALSSTAIGDAGGAKVVDASLTGIPAAFAGKTLQGVVGGGLPWRLDRGSARLFADGRLQVTVDGLVLAAGSNEGNNPIATGRAIVTCAGEPAALSTVVDFSPTGDARVNETVDLPASCLAPAVFFAGITGAGPRWFAVTGN